VCGLNGITVLMRYDKSHLSDNLLGSHYGDDVCGILLAGLR